MKKILMLPFLALSLLAFSCKAKNDEAAVKFTQLTMWYSPTYTEEAPIPANWEGYKIIREKLAIDLMLIPVATDDKNFMTRLNDAMATGILPDLFSTSSEGYEVLLANEVLAPLDNFYAMIPNRTAQMYDEDARRASFSNGHYWRLAQPGSVSKNEGILIRKDWLDKLELPVPETTEDFLNVMRAFSNRDPDRNGRNDTYGFGAFLESRQRFNGLGKRFAPLFGAFGVEGTYDISKENAGLSIYNPAYYDAVSFVHQIIEEGLIDPNWTAYKKDDFRDAWKAGRFGIMLEQNAAFALEANYSPFDKKFPDGEWIVINPPKGPEGFCSNGTYTRGYRTYVVSKRAQDEGKLSAIARLLEWMSSDEGYYLLAYGQKGVNYTIDAEGHVSTSGILDSAKAYTEKAVLPYLQLRNFVFYNNDEELRARYPVWYTEKSREMSALTVLRQMQKTPWTNADYSSSLPSPSKELKKAFDTGLMDFVTGRRALTRETWNQWVSSLGDQGAKELHESSKKIIEDNNYFAN